MYIIAFLLLIVSITKILGALSITKHDIEDINSKISSSIPINLNILPAIVLTDGLLGLLSGLFILVW